MEIESLKKKPLPLGYKMSLGSVFFTFDLPTLIENLKKNHTLTEGELNSMVLLRTPEKSQLLTAMQEGAEVMSHQSGDSFRLEVIEGKIIFQLRKQTIYVMEGQVLTLMEKSKYTLIAMEDAVFILTIANEHPLSAANNPGNERKSRIN